MKTPRRTFLQFVGASVAAPAFSRVARAQAYPTRPITMIVPFAAGGPVDAFGRLLGERMKKSLGQPIVAENVGGGDGTIGTGRAARAKPDGYTINIGVMDTHALNGAVYSLPYDVLNDLAPIAPLAVSPQVLYAKTTMPASDFNALVAWLKANPNRASAAIVAGVGFRLLYAFFQKETGTKFTIVPYRGAAPAMQDLVAGHIDLAFAAASWLPLVRAGNIKAYATTSDARLAPARDLPTFTELGLPALSFSGWYALFAPKGTSRDIIGKLNAAVTESLADPVVQSQATDRGLEIFPRDQQTPEALAALRKADAEKWWPIIKELEIKAE